MGRSRWLHLQRGSTQCGSEEASSLPCQLSSRCGFPRANTTSRDPPLSTESASECTRQHQSHVVWMDDSSKEHGLVYAQPRDSAGFGFCVTKKESLNNLNLLTLLLSRKIPNQKRQRYGSEP